MTTGQAELEQVIVTRLATDAAVAALVVARIYPLAAPQTADVPNIAYQRISGVPELAHDGPAGLSRARIQFTCMASTYAGAKALATAVRLCLHGWKSGLVCTSVDSDRDDYSRAFGAHVVRLDIRAWYQE